jgi:hypothetical protein
MCNFHSIDLKTQKERKEFMLLIKSYQIVHLVQKVHNNTIHST